MADHHQRRVEVALPRAPRADLVGIVDAAVAVCGCASNSSLESDVTRTSSRSTVRVDAKATVASNSYRKELTHIGIGTAIVRWPIAAGLIPPIIWCVPGADVDIRGSVCLDPIRIRSPHSTIETVAVDKY